MSNLLLRTLTGVAMAGLALWLTYAGGAWFDLFAIGLCGLVFAEYQAMTQPYYTKPAKILAWLFYIALGIIMLLNFPLAVPLSALLALAGLLACFSFYALPDRLAGSARAYWCSLGFLYSALPMIAMIILRKPGMLGSAGIFYLFVIVWGSDIGGYFGGKSIGGAKLAPRISPNKTWSGALCGVFAALIFAGVLKYLLGQGQAINLSFVLLTCCLAIFSQLGYLFESILKRRFGLKDSGRLLPGHGGVMDRVDGLLFAALALFIMTLWKTTLF